MSRHSALNVARALSTTRPASVGRQALDLSIGSGLIGVAVAFLVEARLGLAPYDVLASALSTRLSLSLGQAGWAMAAVFFLVATLLGRPPSFWAVAFVALNGAAVDAASGILAQPSTVALRLVFVVAGIVVMAVGINVVVHSTATGGPFELLMAAGEDRGVSPVLVRCSLDLGVLVGGVVLGGAFGPATVVYALVMGVVIVTLSEVIERHRLRSRSVAPVEHDEPIGARLAG